MKYYNINPDAIAFQRLLATLSKVVLCLILLLTVAFSPVSATKRYVKEVSNGLADGSSWINASSDLQAMIDASIEGDTVWVAGGTYLPDAYPTSSTGGANSRDFAFTLKDKIVIIGGFFGNEVSLAQRTTSVLLANPSILSGDINGTTNDLTDDIHHILVAVKDTTVIDGFTIKNGYADQSVSIVVEGQNIERNNGAGLFSWSSQLTISNCSFVENEADEFGGAIFSEASTIDLRNNVFTTNVAKQGAGLHVDGGKYNIIHSVFYANSATNGGGIYTMASLGNTSNSLFSENISTKGGGMFIASPADSIINCTFFKNSSTSGGGAITSSGAGVHTKLLYNLFWDNMNNSSSTVSNADILTELAAKATFNANSLQLVFSNANYPNTNNFVGTNVFNNDPL
ncbi:MAG: hypothetical protein AB8F74_23185, partial [Saprospiraceae bacterium]